MIGRATMKVTVLYSRKDSRRRLRKKRPKKKHVVRSKQTTKLTVLASRS